MRRDDPRLVMLGFTAAGKPSRILRTLKNPGCDSLAPNSGWILLLGLDRFPAQSKTGLKSVERKSSTALLPPHSVPYNRLWSDDQTKNSALAGRLVEEQADVVERLRVLQHVGFLLFSMGVHAHIRSDEKGLP